MKNYILISSIIITITLSSCHKNYNCVCTTTLRQAGYLPHQTATVQEVAKNTSKKNAESICKNTASQMQANTSLLFNSNITVETACSLQE